MTCISSDCAACGHPTPAPSAALELERSLLAATLSLLSSLPPPPKKSPLAAQLKVTLRATKQLTTSAHRRARLPTPTWTAAAAVSLLRAFSSTVLPVIESRHHAVLDEHERWEARMPDLLREEASGGSEEVALEEVWRRKKEKWVDEVKRIARVGEEWQELGAWLREVARRGVQRNEGGVEALAEESFLEEAQEE